MMSFNFSFGFDSNALIKGGGVPSWVRKAADGTVAIADADYANNRFWANGQVYADRLSWVAAADPIILSSVTAGGTVVLTSTMPATGGATQIFVELNDGTANNRLFLCRSSTRVGRFVDIVATVSQADFAVGALADGAVNQRQAAGWAINDIVNYTNGSGASDTVATIPSALSVVSRIANYQTLFSRETYFGKKLNNIEIMSYTVPSNAIINWGDSFTQGVVTPAPPALLSTALSGRFVYNGGVGGEDSPQILSRMRLYPELWNKPTIIEIGRNTVGKIAGWANQIKADIAASIALLSPGTKYLVVGIPISASDDSATIAGIIQLNSELAALYADAFVDMMAIMWANGDGSANDIADIAAKYIPRSKRATSDPLHLGAAGNSVLVSYDGGQTGLRGYAAAVAFNGL